MRSQLLALGALALSAAGLVTADIEVDTLVSRRLQKRFIDDSGNYNISFYHINDVHA